MPRHDEDSQELFQQKQYFMYSVFNKVLQSDMGKTIVRRHVPTLDAQSLWREFESHMSTSSKRLNERCKDVFMIDLGKALLNFLFYTSMNNSDS